MRPLDFAKKYDIHITAIRTAVKNGSLDTVPFTNYRGRLVYNIVMNKKVSLFVEKYREKKKTKTIHLKPGAAWSYRDDAMGNGCRP